MSAKIEDADKWFREESKPPKHQYEDGSRGHWFLHDSDGHPYDWSIVRLPDGFHISNDPWPAYHNHDLRPSLKHGPFPNLKAAKVAYRLRVALGEVPRYEA